MIFFISSLAYMDFFLYLCSRFEEVMSNASEQSPKLVFEYAVVSVW